MERPDELVEIRPLVEESVINETLSRIGIANKKQKILYPSCYLYRNFEKYYIVHFKSMFTLTRVKGYNNISQEDFERRNSIIFCLKNWKLIEIVDEKEIIPHNKFVFVLPHRDKKYWKIAHKFNIHGTEMLQ